MQDIQVMEVPRPEWKDTRDTVMQAVIERAAGDERVVVLDADVSKSTRSRRFGAEYPGRFFNVGVAEMHMASMAAAMAADGFRPYICSFATFLALRALEPIRTQIAYPKLPVVMLGGYAGLTAMQHGPTHQCLIDLGVYTALQGVTVYSPTCSVSAADLASAAAEADGPVYLRIGYNVQRPIYKPGQVKPGGCYRLRQGRHALLLCTGLLTAEALRAAELLEKDGIELTVVDCPTLKPFPAQDVAEAAAAFGRVFTLEDHVRAGGLYAAVLAALNEHGVPAALTGLNMGDCFAESASYDVLLQHYRLDGPGIADAVRAGLS